MPPGQNPGRGEWGEVRPEKWVGVCGPLPKTLILLMTKMPNFPYPMTKMAKNDIQFMTKTAEKTYPLGPHIPI